jgi:hypothetical protein
MRSIFFTEYLSHDGTGASDLVERENSAKVVLSGNGDAVSKPKFPFHLTFVFHSPMLGFHL